jgi:hypothetical protein
MNQHPLNTPWSLWYHSINDTKWNKQSYKSIYTVKDLYDLQGLHEVIQKIHLQNGMFFLMRDDIFPTWEDPDNREGCCISYKVPGQILKDQWSYIVDRIVSEDIIKDKNQWNQVNGVSIAPKKEFNIVKIWLRNMTDDFTSLLKEYEPVYTKDKSITKKHELAS